MDETALRDLLAGLDPVLVGLVVPAAVLTKALVSLLRATVLRRLRGNAVQTLTFGIAALAVLLLALGRGCLAEGMTPRLGASLVLVALAAGTSAIGLHEVLTDRG